MKLRNFVAKLFRGKGGTHKSKKGRGSYVRGASVSDYLDEYYEEWYNINIKNMEKAKKETQDE